MDISSLIALASVAGAGLFFSSGYVLHGLRKPADDDDKANSTTPTASESKADSEQQQQIHQLQEQLIQQQQALEAKEQQVQQSQAAAGQVAQLQAELKQKQQALQAAMQQSEKLQGELETARAEQAADASESTRVDANLAQALQSEQELAKANKRIAELENAQSGGTQGRGRVPQSLVEIDALKQQVKQLETQLQQSQSASQELAEAQRRLREVEGTLESARTKAERSEALLAENSKLRNEIEHLSKTTVSDKELEKLQIQQADMQLKANIQQKKLAEMERHAAENASLRQQLGDYEGLVAERDSLRVLVQSLKAKAFAAGILDTEENADDATNDRDNEKTLVVNLDEMNSKMRRRSDDKVMDAAIEKLLTEQMSKLGLHNAVLADTQGFPLAAAGPEERLEALAVITSMIADLGEQSRGLLPVGQLSSCELGDDNGLRLNSQFFDADGQALALTMLGQAQKTEVQELRKLAESVAKIVREGQQEA